MKKKVETLIENVQFFWIFYRKGVTILKAQEMDHNYINYVAIIIAIWYRFDISLDF